MKRRLLQSLLLATLLVGGCGGKTQPTLTVPTATQTPTAEINKEVRPGIYMSNDPADFPFPTSGYAVYIVGETHGNQQTKQVFQTYLKVLYNKTGLRDVILEEHQAYESDANAYLQGRTAALPDELCRRTDILGMIREFNATLPTNDKVVVHLVDVDSPLSVIYKHLIELHTRLGSKGTSIQVSPLSEMETWSPKLVYDLMDSLQNTASDDSDILKELQTLRLSFRWYFLGNELDSDTKATVSFTPLREDIIAQNIQNLISRLDDKPILVFFGSAHAMKANPFLGSPVKNLRTWAQRLTEAGVSVYSLDVEPMAGSGYWRGETLQYAEYARQYQFENGSLLSSLFDTHPDAGIIYADLRAEENKNFKLPNELSPGVQQLQDMPASQVYDGLVIFKEVTPMENACSGLN